MRRVLSSFNLNTFVNLWNKNDETSVLKASQNISITFLIHTPEYFKIRLEYYGCFIYEIVYADGQWWKARRIINSDSDDNNKELVNINGIINGTTELLITGGPDESAAGRLALFDKDVVGSLSGAFYLNSYNKDTNARYFLTGTNDGALTWNGHDLAGSAIQEKSFGTNNGYIVYASKLIIQWGRIFIPVNTNSAISTLPISFNSMVVSVGNVNYVDNSISATVRAININVSVNNMSFVKAVLESVEAAGDVYVNYIAIGY